MFVKALYNEFDNLPTAMDQLNGVKEKRQYVNKMIRILEKTQISGYETSLNGYTLKQGKEIKKAILYLGKLVRGM